MDVEIAALHSQNTWMLVPPLPGVQPIPRKWVYTVEHNPDDSIARYKAGLVIGSFTRIYGMGYFKTFFIGCSA